MRINIQNWLQNDTTRKQYNTLAMPHQYKAGDVSQCVTPWKRVNEVSVNAGSSCKSNSRFTCKSLSLSAGAPSDSRSVRFSLVVNIVPRDDVLSAGSCRSAHCEDEPSIKRSFQQPADLLAFSITWQVSGTTCAFKTLTWIWMILLRVRQYTAV